MATNLYALIEQRPGHPNFGLPFYIGIGTSKRPYRHLEQSRSKRGHRNWRLHEVIVSHRIIGLIPGIEFLAIYEKKSDAGEAEKELIKKYGRLGIDPGGILCNLAVGGQGPDVELMQLPEIRKRNSDSQKRRDRSSWYASTEAARRNAVDKDINARRSISSTAHNKMEWSDPEKSAKRIAAMKGKKKTMTHRAIESRKINLEKARSEEFSQIRHDAAIAKWRDPAFRQKRSVNQSAAWDDPEKRANMLAGRSEGISKSWQDPETREKRIAAIKAAYKKPTPEQEAKRIAAIRASAERRRAEKSAAKDASPTLFKTDGER